MLSSGFKNLLLWLKEQSDNSKEIINNTKELVASKLADQFKNNKTNFFGDFFSNIENFFTNRNLAKENVDLDNLDILQSLENMMTGNYDYARNFELQSQAQAFNAAEAQKARDYNTEMSNTAYQRQVADLEAAGLNPAVALGGSGASVGSAAVASSNARNYNGNDGLARLFGNLTNVLLGTLNSAVSTNNLDKKLDLMERELAIKQDFNRLKASELAWKKSRDYHFKTSDLPTADTYKAVEIFNRLF